MLAYQAAYEGVGENSRQLPKPEEAGKGGPVPERGGTMELEGGNPITAPARGEGTTLRGWGWGGSLGSGRSGGGGEVHPGLRDLCEPQGASRSPSRWFSPHCFGGF